MRPAPPFAWIDDLVRQARDAGVKVISRATCSTATRAFSNLPFHAPIDPEPAEVPAVFIS
jgi:hypothetical protein